jgi:hypothetical protein
MVSKPRKKREGSDWAKLAGDIMKGNLFQTSPEMRLAIAALTAAIGSDIVTEDRTDLMQEFAAVAKLGAFLDDWYGQQALGGWRDITTYEVLPDWVREAIYRKAPAIDEEKAGKIAKYLADLGATATAPHVTFIAQQGRDRLRDAADADDDLGW